MYNNIKLYNTPLEIGLRSLIILSHTKGDLDIEKLMYLDFMCLNTFDMGGPESLHAPIPNRGIQLFSKKELIQKGLAIMLSKELIEFKPTSGKGFMYSATEAGHLFLTYFQTKYYVKLVERSQWVISNFENYTNIELKQFIDINLQKWGGEFTTTHNLELL
ncbi:ABC-three component system middle component 2 [Chryseobacterium arthrosphaerae]|uniref:ABC-three component system middle component 2 n=1 Tax=Chryseobacterium arthrosphaerae TaxID=651561 RepID=UPI001F4A56B5|nr:ABC-three component system middle component 2 [Chryseobacterium arthrosphaerae]MDG4654747.1 hypothetical protein [Chryseobacterium arthrosphaerae]